MFRFLPAPVRAVLALLMYLINTVGCFIVMVPVILLKAIIPHRRIRQWLTLVLMFFGMGWIHVNSLILKISQNIKWDVEGLEGFNPKHSYLVISNHRSWADILVLQHLLKHRIPFLKFFLKKELMWVPMLGLAWWALDFPFMKRYSKEFVEKHPELRGKDIETTKKYCEKFKSSPISVINFLEGTRFNKAKHDKFKSPFRHLLPPKAGGAAIVLSTMSECLSGIVDVTIAYPHNEPPVTFWDFLAGRITVVAVRVRLLPIPEEFIGKNYEQDEAAKKAFRDWINGLWQEKDRQIDDILKTYP